MKKKLKLPNFTHGWEAYLKQEMKKINYPHIKCLKRCDDNRCDCIKDFIDFLKRKVK